MAAFWRQLTSRLAVALGRPREGRHPPRHGGGRQRRVGSLGQGRGQAAVEAAGGHDARGARRRASTSATSPTRSRRTRRCDPARARAADARRAKRRCVRDGYPAYTTSAGWLGYSDGRDPRVCCREGDGRRLDAFQDQGRRDLRRRPAPRRDHPRGDRPGPQADDGREPGAGMCDEAIDWMRELARVRSVVDRGADEPGRRAGPRGDRARDRADRRRHRRAVPEPRHLQAAPAGRTRWASARSTAAASAA